MQIDVKQGDATSPRPTPGLNPAGERHAGVIIAHLCNSSGAWGKGFVLAVNDLSPAPKAAYRDYARKLGQKGDKLPLGVTQFVEVQPNLWVANMIAQNGIDKAAVANGVLVDYKALDECLKEVFRRAILLRCNVHIPKGMGSGLAGGDKATIEGIIQTIAKGTMVDLLEKERKFSPMVTLWEFNDTSAASYVGAPAAFADAEADTDADPITDLDQVEL